MRRLSRWLFTVAVVASLAACLAVCVLWVRSYRPHSPGLPVDGVRWFRGDTWVEAGGRGGGLYLLRGPGCAITANGPSAPYRITAAFGGVAYSMRDSLLPL